MISYISPFRVLNSKISLPESLILIGLLYLSVTCALAALQYFIRQSSPLLDRIRILWIAPFSHVAET